MNNATTPPALVVHNVSKVYHIYGSPKDRFKESFNPFGKAYHQEFFALANIDFELAKGERMAIMGVNGAGKSTLLKIIAGVIKPTVGETHVEGRLSSLLELGTGFDPDLSGLENIYFYGTINGISKKHMQEKLDDILSFADIGDYVYQPVKTYSSGMLMRLGFAAATTISPDVLIVDEAISVGDMFFQAKCIKRMRDMMDNGTSLLFVSHDIGAIKSLCTKAILLDNGRIAIQGGVEDVTNHYLALHTGEAERKQQQPGECRSSAETSHHLKNALHDREAFEKRASYDRITGGRACFLNIQLLDAETKSVTQHIDYGQRVIIRMVLRILEDIDSKLTVGYHIRDYTGADIVYSDSAIEDTSLDNPCAGQDYIIDWTLPLELRQGQYNIATVCSIPINMEAAQVDMCDFVPAAYQFSVAPRPGAPLHGHIHLTAEIQTRCYNIMDDEEQTS